MYGTLGIAGFLSVVGAACVLFTMWVAFQTKPGDEGSTLLNVDRGEELLFVIIEVLQNRTSRSVIESACAFVSSTH